jgi:transposase
VFGPAQPVKAGALVAPDCAWIHNELKRHRHVTLQLLWEEYAQRYSDAAYRRSAFCEIYRRWEKRLKRSMRQRHFAGEKLFVDYAGRTVPIYGRSGEESFRAQLFVSALGASGCAYAEATRTQQLADWLASHVRALEYYGAALTIIVPDNPRVGVTRADRYEPELQRSYEELAAHYQAVVIPARPYRPKDKSRAELTVLLVCRWILARLRHQRFFSLEELNAAIRPLLTELNERPFQRLPGCRRSVFEALDRPAMRALPPAPTCMPSGGSARLPSTITSMSISITTACRTPSSVAAYGRFTATTVVKCFPRRARGQSRAFISARRHDAPEHAEGPSRRRWSPKRSSVGRVDPARTPARSSSTCCAPSRIPSRAIGRD